MCENVLAAIGKLQAVVGSVGMICCIVSNISYD